MSLRGRMAAICGVLSMVALAACSESPTQPTRFPIDVDITTGQALTVPGTELSLRLDALGPCPPNASCLAGPRVRLTARIGGSAPIDVGLHYPFGGPPAPQRIDGYTVTVRSFAELPGGGTRVSLFIDRVGDRSAARLDPSDVAQRLAS